MPLRACCPQDAPCHLNQKDPLIRTGEGADFLVAVLPNGRLATNVRELSTVCSADFLEGAVDYPDTVFAPFSYPTNSVVTQR